MDKIAGEAKAVASISQSLIVLVFTRILYLLHSLFRWLIPLV